MIYLAGMAAPGAGANLNSGVRNYPTVQISVAGGLDNGMTYLLDGGTPNDPYNNLNLPLPFPDALQEFKLETSTLPAQYGHHSSAAVNAVTKSGTNEFHGDAFEFLRNGSLNARNAFALRRDSLKRNQFGGTIGGSIKKNKLFFFGGYQGTTTRSAATTNIAYVPTTDMLAGDFTAVTSPSCNTTECQIDLLAPFVNNRISPSRFSAPSLGLGKHLPTAADPCGHVCLCAEESARQRDGRVQYRRRTFDGEHLQHDIVPVCRGRESHPRAPPDRVWSELDSRRA